MQHGETLKVRALMAWVCSDCATNTALTFQSLFIPLLFLYYAMLETRQVWWVFCFVLFCFCRAAWLAGS